MKPDPEYIEVAVAVPVFQTFTYSAPENIASLVSAGKRVLIPFGRRRITGYVLGPSRGVDQKEVKSVLDVLDDQPLFPPAMVPFFRWISDYYKYPLGEVIKNALPGGLNVRDYALVALTADGQNCIEGGQLNPIAKQILCHLQSGPCRVKELFNQIDRGIPGALLYSLEQQGLIAHKWELSKARAKARRERFVQLTGVQPEAGQLSRSRAKVLEVLAESGEISVKQLARTLEPRCLSRFTPASGSGIQTLFTSLFMRPLDI